ncbi:MAG: diacylglycerol/polyprenol kinase family protein [Ignavibacteria bacterium]
MSKFDQITYLGEIQRKSIHIVSMLIPIIYFFIDTKTALLILFPMTIITILIDMSLYYSETVRNIAYPILGGMLRPHERERTSLVLNGASWVMIAACITIAVFPKPLAIIGYSIVILSDIAAALIGRKYGTIPFMDKSLQGSAAFFVVALIVSAIWTWIFEFSLLFYGISVFGSLIATVAEASTTRLKLDDNLAVPISYAGITWLLSILCSIPLY